MTLEHIPGSVRSRLLPNRSLTGLLVASVLACNDDTSRPDDGASSLGTSDEIGEMTESASSQGSTDDPTTTASSTETTASSTETPAARPA